MSEENIAVVSDELLNKAQTIDLEIDKVKTSFQIIREKMNRCNYYWNGISAEIHKNTYKELQQEIDKVLERFELRQKILLETMGNFKKKSNDADKIIENLPDDIIQ